MTTATKKSDLTPKLIPVAGPPVPKRRGKKPAPTSPVTRWLLAIRKTPGQWYRYPTRMYGATASQIRLGKGYGASKGDYEVLGYDGKDEKYVVYARFVGKDKK